MKTRSYVCVVVALVLVGWGESLNAATIEVATWHLGEADLGAVAGTPVFDPATDSSPNGSHLTVGCPCLLYTSFAAPGSTLAASSSDLGGGFYGPSVTSVVDNFVMEIWAAPSSIGGNRGVFYNGFTGNTGWGIYQIGSNWQILFGGIVLSNFTAPVELNVYNAFGAGAQLRRRDTVCQWVFGGLPQRHTEPAGLPGPSRLRQRVR